MVPGTKSNHWHVGVHIVTIGLSTDIRYEKDCDQPIKEQAGRVSSEHIFRQSLKACISQVRSIQVSIGVVSQMGCDRL